MSVEEKTVPDGGTATTTTSVKGPKQGSFGAFVKKNKILVGAVGLGGAVLLLASHGKGKSGTGNATQELTAEQQQALDNERAAAEAGSILPAAAPATAGASEGSSGITGTAGENAGNQTPAEGTAANPNEAATAAALAEVGGDINKLTGALETAEQKQENAAGEAAATTQGGGTKKPKEKTKAKLKDKQKKHPKKSTEKTHHTGTHVKGRHFPGAHGHTTSGTHRDGHGHVITKVKVHYGGRTDNHEYNNTTKKWTDHPRGATPPKRGTEKTSSPGNTHHATHHAPAKPKRFKRVRA